MTVTFAQLLVRSRTRADEDGSQFITDAELRDYVNASAAELYDLLVASFQDYYLSQSPDYVVPNGVDVITLPANFYKLRGVDRSVSANRWAKVDAFSFAERNDRQIALGRAAYFFADAGIRYKVQAGTIKLTPADSCSGTYRVWYIPRMPMLALAADIFDDQNQWSEYIVVDVAIKCLQKSESSVTGLQQQKAALLKRIESMSRTLDAGAPEVITDGQGQGWPL